MDVSLAALILGFLQKKEENSKRRENNIWEKIDEKERENRRRILRVKNS